MPRPSRASRALTQAHTIAMDSISSVALQAFTDVSPLRVDAVRHAPIAAVRARSALVNVCGAEQGTGHRGQETITSINKLKHLCHGPPSDCVVTWHLCMGTKWEEKDFVVFFGMKFDGGVLNPRKSTLYNQLEIINTICLIKTCSEEMI